MGDSVGRYGINAFGLPGPMPGEVLCKRVNIRVVIVKEKDKNFVQELIESINPELAKTIAFLTTKEIEEFEKKREKFEKNIKQDVYLNLFTCDFIDTFKNRLPFKFFSGKMKKIEDKEIYLEKFSKEVISNRYGYNEVWCEPTKTKAVMLCPLIEDQEKSALERKELIQSVNPELVKTVGFITYEEIKERENSDGTYNNYTYKKLPIKCWIGTVKELTVVHYTEDSVSESENINSKEAILANFQKACEYYSKATKYYENWDDDQLQPAKAGSMSKSL